MESKLLPDQVSSYREIVFNNLAFVDKTMFIQKLEEKFIKVPLFLRPGRFGKTLFTDILSEYYDVDNAFDFEKLFGNTYIGKNPTATGNSYYILRFDFSGIDSSHPEKNFFETVKNQLKIFCSKYSSLNLTVNENSVSPASILEDLVTSFIEKRPHKTDQFFVIIDEYDNFANDVLATDVEQFKSMTSAEGFVKNFYARLKALSGSSLSAIGRFFMKGSLSGRFNNMSDLEETGDKSVFTECLREVITGIIPDNEKDVTERAIVSIAGTLILGNLEHCRTETEYEIWHNGCKTDKRADLVILNKDRNKPSFLIEFKYIREKAARSESTRKRNISKVKRTAREQLAEYMTDDRLKEIPNLNRYITVYAYGELFFEKLKEKKLMSQHKSQTAIKQYLHAHSVLVLTQLMQTFMNI